MKSIQDVLDHQPCDEGQEWLLYKDRTPKEAWEECPRSDWLLWAAGKAGVDNRLLVQCAIACARMALKYVPDEEDRPRLAIEAAEAWLAHSSPSTVEAAEGAAKAARAAGAAAWAAAKAAEAAAGAAAGSAARAAEAAAGSAARAAEAAAGAAAGSAARAAGAAAGAARAAGDTEEKEALQQCADFVRSVIPFGLVAR